MKTLTFKRSTGVLMSILLASAILMSCSKEDESSASMKLPNASGYSQSLSELEKEGMVYMAEQQKLLQNIYECMFANHGEDVFKKNAVSKKQQSLLLSAKIDKYGIDNPLHEKVNGEFVNPQIQQAYNEFKSAQTMGPGDCILYSKAMEEAMIADLEVLLQEVEGNHDLVAVYRKILETTQSNLQDLFLDTKGLIDISVWYDPIKVFEPVNKNLRDIKKVYNPIKEF